MPCLQLIQGCVTLFKFECSYNIFLYRPTNYLLGKNKMKMPKNKRVAKFGKDNKLSKFLLHALQEVYKVLEVAICQK